jgi:hypothetical protein
MKTGIVLHLGHHGEPCPHWRPSYWRKVFIPEDNVNVDVPDTAPPGTSHGSVNGTVTDASNSTTGSEDVDPFLQESGPSLSNDDWGDLDDIPDMEFRPTSTMPQEARSFYDDDAHIWTLRRDLDGNPVLVFVDRSGLHPIPVVACTCTGAPTEDIQFLDLGLFPASFDRIRTVFSFQVLDDYLAENQECKTSAMHYFQKLRRFTNTCFPLTAPVSVLIGRCVDILMQNNRTVTGNSYGSPVSGGTSSYGNGMALGMRIEHRGRGTSLYFAQHALNPELICNRVGKQILYGQRYPHSSVEFS